MFFMALLNSRKTDGNMVVILVCFIAVPSMCLQHSVHDNNKLKLFKPLVVLSE